MRIISQTSDEMSITHGNTATIFLASIVLLACLWIIVSNPSIYQKIASALLIFITGYFIEQNPRISVTLNKITGQILFTRRSIFKRENVEYSIKNVKKVEFKEFQNYVPIPFLRPSFYSSSRFGLDNKIAYQSLIVMNDGSEVPLENIKSIRAINLSAPSGIYSKNFRLPFENAESVAAFMGVPLEKTDGGVNYTAATGSIYND